MSAVGGSIESVSIAGRTMSVASDADANVKLGGSEPEIQTNGDGTVRKIDSRVAWSISGLTLSIDEDRDDQEFIQERANSPEPQPISITYADGTTRQGSGWPVGELQKSTQNATLPVELSGPGKLTKQ